MVLIGSHVSFKKDTGLKGSVLEALSYNANCLMIYTGAPQNTVRNKIDRKMTEEALEIIEGKIDLNNIIVHAPYIINLANSSNMDFNISFLTQELKRVEELHINKLVLHPGSHVGQGSEKGLNNIIYCLNKVIDKTNVTILLETMALKGTELGSIDDIKYILDNVNSNKLGVCIDTCHLNDSGYDMKCFNEFLKEFNRKIGINKIGCVHINDSKNVMYSHKDRHENIGFGTIGFENLINVIYNEQIKEVPKILETPYIEGFPPYKYEIEMIRNKKFNSNLKDHVIKNSGI